MILGKGPESESSKRKRKKKENIKNKNTLGVARAPTLVYNVIEDGGSVGALRPSDWVPALD